MPKSTGELTDAERAEIAKRLNELAAGGCPHCGGNKASLSREVVLFPVRNLGSGYGAVLTICDNCGLMKAFSITALGISTNPDEWNDE